jgi:hypothetical protein
MLGGDAVTFAPEIDKKINVQSVQRMIGRREGFIIGFLHQYWVWEIRF